MTKAGGTARIVLFNAILLCVGGVALELVFGNWFRPNRMNRLNIPRSVTRDYDSSALYPSANPVVRYTRDEWGLRGGYDSPANIHILTVGGSATDQHYVADGATWQDVIVREFAAEGKQVSVVNAGVDGQSTHKTRALGSTPVFVTQARYEYRRRPDGVVEGNASVFELEGAPTNGVDIYIMMSMLTQATIEVCREVDGICIDAANEVGWQAEHFYDGVHNTPTGCEELGRYLHSRLRHCSDGGRQQSGQTIQRRGHFVVASGCRSSHPGARRRQCVHG
jgi:hypothetical protein